MWWLHIHHKQFFYAKSLLFFLTSAFLSNRNRSCFQLPCRCLVLTQPLSLHQWITPLHVPFPVRREDIGVLHRQDDFRARIHTCPMCDLEQASELSWAAWKVLLLSLTSMSVALLGLQLTLSPLLCWHNISFLRTQLRGSTPKEVTGSQRCSCLFHALTYCIASTRVLALGSWTVTTCVWTFPSLAETMIW